MSVSKIFPTSGRPSKVALVFGTRPEIIKMTSVIRELQERSIPYVLIHSNQHYSRALDEIFFDDLELPQVHYNLAVGSGQHGNQTAKIVMALEPILEAEQPSVVLVQGDTNTVLAAALTATKLDIPVGHIEAGLRSYDRTMPEEKNRVIVDSVSDFLFAVTKVQEQILMSEGIPAEKIFVVGNTIVDAALWASEHIAAKSRVLETLGLQTGQYLLATIHRASNVDKTQDLKKVLEVIFAVANEANRQVVWPVHPRSKSLLEESLEFFSETEKQRLTLLDPQGYFDFLALLKGADCILTDSGGVQEEACILGVPTLTLRENTERPETVDVGSNILVGRDPKRALTAYKELVSGRTKWDNPFGDGKAGKHIVDVLESVGLARSAFVTGQTISVVGMGYMGLPMACLIADAGYRVIGVDISESKIAKLQSGRLPLGEDEPGFKNLFQRVLASGRLTFSTKPVEADIFVVAVPTDQRNKRIDLSCVVSATQSLVPVLADDNLVIVESTIKPGTADSVVTEIVNQSGKRVHVAHCPERAVPGNTLWELVNNDRIVGGVTPAATNLARRFYSSFVKGRVLETCSRTAECAKLMENTFRDVNIALANEFDQILAELGVATEEAVALANCHPRVNILSAGPGVGGHCIPVDPYFLVEDCVAGDLVRRARQINHNRPKLLLDNLCERNLLGKKVAVAGVAYKPGVDDARESPAQAVVELLEERGYEVRCTDPFVQQGWVRTIEPLEQLLNWADSVLVVTEHQEYQDLESSKKLVLRQALSLGSIKEVAKQAA